jgi:hypothetical protein
MPVNAPMSVTAPVLTDAENWAQKSFSLASGTMPPGVSLDTASGAIQGTPTADGTFRCTVRVSDGANSATAGLIFSVVPPPAGLGADRPVFTFERNGVFVQPWGAAGFAWPQQLFWNNVSMIDEHYFDMILEAENCEAAGLAPLLGCVAWGYEYTAATGGNADAGIADMSEEDGWKQFGQWMSDPAHAKYRSTNWNGEAEAGYVTPLMPMDKADWPAEWGAWPFDTDDTYYGQWMGYQLATLCLHIGCRGLYCADYLVGLEWGDAIDYNERVIDAFAEWAGIVVPGETIAARADYIQENCKSLWYDFKCTVYSSFYATTARVLLDNGKTPRVGGQLGGYPALLRGSGLDPRLYAHGEYALPGEYWFFNIELQSDWLRPASGHWLSAACMGSSACYEPDIPLGSQMDAAGGQGAFDSALEQAGKSAEWGAKLLKHQWLSVGWTHMLGRDGLVHRSTQSFMRSYWDAGSVDETVLATMFAHVPCHPFGPAMYYSRTIQNSFETGNGKYGNSWWAPQILLSRELSPAKQYYPHGAARGLCLGFWASDVTLDGIDPVDQPTAWIVYDSDRLPQDERAKLEAIAPVIDIAPDGNTPDLEDAARLLAGSPVHVEQAEDQCLNALAFIDQNDSVILMVTNSLESEGRGTLVFNGVPDGEYACNGLIGTAPATLVVSGGTGRFDITVSAMDTVVYEIPGLHRSGRDRLAWADPDYERSVNGWVFSKWYGWCYNDHAMKRWIFSPAHSWQYVFAAESPASVFIWDEASAHWWWTGKGAYPWIYVYGRGWCYYMGGEAPLRQFYDWATDSYPTF